MSTALSELFLQHQPFKSSAPRDGSFGTGKMTSSYRRPSGATSATSASSYSQPRAVSPLEDSNNPNNREIYQRSGSQLRNLERTDSNRSSNAAAPTQQQSSVGNHSSNNNNSNGEYVEETVVEEKRKRLNGDGYTVHRYTLGRLLGKGGFAKVYLCTAMDTGKNYAVKVVPKANLVKARARQKVRAVCESAAISFAVG